MRFIAVFPVLMAIAAFVLAMLCVFAGSKPGFMEDYNILTLNTSGLGENTTFAANLPAIIQNDINGAVHSIAQRLNIHDFYSVHILDFCEGYYVNPNSAKNVTSCSNQTALFTFDPNSILQNELKAGVTLQDLNWPSDIQSAINALRIAMQAMNICYYIGIGLAGLAIITGIITFFTNGRIGAFFNWVICFLSFAALGVASAIATVISVKVVDAINQYGNQVGVSAYKGTNFLIITWVATSVMLLASFLWIVDCCIGRGRKREVDYNAVNKTERY